MASINLLDLNVDQLFEQHNVAEIDAVHKKIQTVVENKREELRTMVGERYRDLLKAADTITAMQESSSTLISQIDCITADCRSLNEQQLIGFQSSDTADMLRNRNANKKLNNYFSTMVQIKLLTSLPELIWSQLDQEHFYKATELFIFSRHISTGLQLDASNQLMQRLPVAKKQWEILRPFHLTIKQHVMKVLEREVLSADIACDCLMSLLLLEKNDLNTVLKILLQLRCTAFTNCLTESVRDSDNIQHTTHRRVKERILASLRVLNSSIKLISKCFIGGHGLLYQAFEDVCSSHPTITLVDSSDAQFAYLLPEIIANFRPKLEPLQLDKEQVRTLIEQWLADVDQIANAQLQQLFELVNNLHTIQEIKHTASADKKHLNFVPIAEEYQLTHSLDFYEQQYAPLINRRVRNIIKDSWCQAMKITYESVTKSLGNAEALQPIDIWSEQTTDLPLSLAEALSEDNKIKHLLMKTKGYNQQVLLICTTFDDQLASIIKELQTLLEEDSTRIADKQALIEFLCTIAEQEMTHFLTQLKSFHLESNERATLLFIVHVCAALIELCPHLKMCFSPTSRWRQWLGNVSNSNNNSSEHWGKFCGLYEEEIYQFWQKIVDGVLEEHHCAKYLKQALTHDVALEDFVHWETVELEQKDEQDNTLNSTFRIPTEPRISLQTYLFSLIRALNAAIPQTLPHKVLSYLNNKLLMQLLQQYEHVTKATSTSTDASATAATETASITQNVALQLYFDLKFLQNIFNIITREDRTLASEFQTLQNAYKNIIDPFDFELFAEHLSANIKRAVLRLHCALGVLTPPMQPSTTTTTSLTQVKEPNVLSLSSCGSTSLWFPLLPIVTTNASASPESKRTAAALNDGGFKTASTRSKVTAAAATRKSDTTSTSTTTTAKSKSFFGAMSQEWFR